MIRKLLETRQAYTLWNLAHDKIRIKLEQKLLISINDALWTKVSKCTPREKMLW